MIDKTLFQLKETKTVSALFSHVLVKFQEQSSTDSSALTIWLKQLLRVHWVTLLKCNPSLLAQNLQALSGLKQVIKVKT